MKIGLIIKELRIKKGLTQEELAEKTELSARTIQRIENGEVDPRAYTLQMIAKALDVDFSLFSDNESSVESRKEDDKTWLALLHLSGLFLLIFPTIIIWYKKRDSIGNMNEHFNDILNFQLSVWALFILTGLFIFLMIKIPFVIYFGLIFSAAISIFNTIRVISDKPYKYILLIKLFDKNGKTKITFK